MSDGYGGCNCVAPKRFSGSNVSWNLNLLSGPKFYIECGQCGAGFEERIRVMNYPRVCCPYCYTVNKLPLVVT